MTRIKLYIVATISIAFVSTAAAFPSYPGNIPNGVRVPCPGHYSQQEAAEQCVGGVCKGVGHTDCRGGDFQKDGEVLNAFGQAFRLAGYQWTLDLCKADSDGDGKTNGQELGDPCCVWSMGKQATVDEEYRVSHPGHAQDTTDAEGPTEGECAALRASLGVASAFDPASFIDSLYLPSEPRSNLTLRVQKHRLLPNETIYTRVYFPVPQDKDYYVVGVLADIVNKLHNHHFVLRTCTTPMSELYGDPSIPAGTPQQPSGPFDNGNIPEGCEGNIYNWAPGAEMFPLPKHLAIKIGKNAPYKAFFLEVHYNNPEGDANATDSSGVTLYTTTQPREHDAIYMWSGSITAVGTIPAGEEAYFNAAECIVDMRPSCSEVKVVANNPHAHVLGQSVWTEHYTPVDTFGSLRTEGYMTSEFEFSYELQYLRKFDKEKTIKRGDLLVTGCTYDAVDRSAPATGGLGSLDEMCIDFLLVYPAECMVSNLCFGYSRIVSGKLPEGQENGPYNTVELYGGGAAPNFTAVAAEKLVTCDQAKISDLEIESAEALLQSLFNYSSQSCPGLIGNPNFTPEMALNYTCSQDCVDYVINYGVCSVTEFGDKHAMIMQATQGFSPLQMLPPSCHVAIAKKLAQLGGGAFSPATFSDQQVAEADSSPEVNGGSDATSSSPLKTSFAASAAASIAASAVLLL